MHPLVSVQEKLDRAREHRNSLNAEFDALMEGGPDSPWALMFDIDGETRECRFWWHQDGPTPLRWSVILGEFLYDLRSALDHLARQLVLVNGRKPNNRTEFPVFRDSEEFEGGSCTKTRGMSAEVKTLIESIQPFSEWPDNPTGTTLWGIHNLGNVDKHKLLHLTDPWLMTAEIRPGGTEIEWVLKPRRMRLYDKAEIASYRWDPASKAKVEMDFHFSLDVALSEGTWTPDNAGDPSEGMSVLRLMNICLDYMETTLLPKFTPYFRPRD